MRKLSSGYVLPDPVLDARGRPIRPAPQGPRDAHAVPRPLPNTNTRAAFPAGGKPRDPRMENRK
jgi:hypothetical protein